jgi:serine/threonine protein kinase
VDTTGRPRLLDFGLALLPHAWDSDETPGPEVSGTPAYMAPEQAEGRGDQIGPRTDVFGLGAVMYEMLTGRAPHSGKSPYELMANAREGSIQPPRQLEPRTPRSLDRLCRRALARDPNQRFSSAAEFRRALHLYLRLPWLLVVAGILALGIGTVLIVLASPPRQAVGPEQGKSPAPQSPAPGDTAAGGLQIHPPFPPPHHPPHPPPHPPPGWDGPPPPEWGDPPFDWGPPEPRGDPRRGPPRPRER